MTDRRRYQQNYNDDAVQFVTSSGWLGPGAAGLLRGPKQGLPVALVATNIGVNEGTLGTWCASIVRFISNGSLTGEAVVPWEEQQEVYWRTRN